ncbi:hypothetical protein AMECASPLE_010809 [Ameca splendens]|uniref:Uncharacterized protein n=1 Tax=Ameca splendens TaxID=208324 RepID=A0ABV0YNR5_9TELE
MCLLSSSSQQKVPDCCCLCSAGLNGESSDSLAERGVQMQEIYVTDTRLKERMIHLKRNFQSHWANNLDCNPSTHGVFK